MHDWRKFWKRFRGCFVFESRVSTKTVVTSSPPSSWVLGYCVEKDDRRWAPMCSHSLNGPVDSGLMMGKEECTSPSGYYELLIPVNKKLDCSATKMKDTNCKDLDVSLRRLCCLWLITYVFRDGKVLRALVTHQCGRNLTSRVFWLFGQRRLSRRGLPRWPTARRLCLRDWCGPGSSPKSTPRLPCSERFFCGSSAFPFSSKTNISILQFIYTL